MNLNIIMTFTFKKYYKQEGGVFNMICPFRMATHSSVPAWRIPGTGKPGGLSVGSQRVGHDWSNLAAAAHLENWNWFASQFSSVVYYSLRPHGLRYARPCCPSPTPRVYSNSCPLSRWCHPTISSSVIIPFSSCLQYFPASGSSQMSQLFTSGGQTIGVSASTSVLQMNIQDWFPLG